MQTIHPRTHVTHPSATHAFQNAGPEMTYRAAVLHTLRELAHREQGRDSLLAFALREIADDFEILDKAHDVASSTRAYSTTNAAACTTTANEYADHARAAWRDLDAAERTTPAEAIEQRDAARYYEREGARLDGMARGYLDACRVLALTE